MDSRGCGNDKRAGPHYRFHMPRDHHYFVYLMASKPNGTLYCGVTNDIAMRALDHAEGRGGTFTRKYRVTRLVWFEQHQYVDQAIAREKIIKKWRRAEKIALIEADNPHWSDLGPGMWR